MQHGRHIWGEPHAFIHQVGTEILESHLAFADSNQFVKARQHRGGSQTLQTVPDGVEARFALERLEGIGSPHGDGYPVTMPSPTGATIATSHNAPHEPEATTQAGSPT